jgi:site-specific DNA recombinase
LRYPGNRKSENAQSRSLETGVEFAKARHWQPLLRVSAALSLSEGCLAGDAVLIAPVSRRISLLTGNFTGKGDSREIRIAWSTKAKASAGVVEGSCASEVAHNEVLIQTIVRAHVWVHCLRDGVDDSIEQLAEANRLHPKVVRQNLRLAFLFPDVISSILEGRQPAELSLARIPKPLPFAWAQHRRLLGWCRRRLGKSRFGPFRNVTRSGAG